MYPRYQPYPYQRRYYSINPYSYGRYYSPYNMYNSQFANVNQSINNFGEMNDVIQNSDVYQLMAPHSSVSPEPEIISESESVVSVAPQINISN